MKKQKNYHLFFLALIFVLFCGCKDVTGTVNSSRKQTKIKIKIAKPDRTALPSFTLSSISNFTFTLLGKGPDDTELQALASNDNSTEFNGLTELQEASFPIQTGEWTFKLTASKDGSVLSGQTTATITAGQNELSFILAWEDTNLSGYGSLSFTIDFADAINKADVKLVTGQLFEYDPSTNITGNSYSDETSILDRTQAVNQNTNSVTYDSTSVPALANLPAGNYKIKLRFYSDTTKTYLLNTWTETAIITGGQTSSASRTMPSFNHSYVVNADGSITFDDGLLDISAVFSEKTYVNEGSVTFGASLKNGGTDLSTSTDVIWDAKLLFGGMDVNDYGSYYTFTAPAGTEAAKLQITNYLDTPGTYQVFVTAQYEGVVSSQTFNYQANEYGIFLGNYDLDDSSQRTEIETQINLAAQSGAPLILTITGEGSDGTDGTDGSLAYLVEKLQAISSTIEMDLSGVSNITKVATGVFGESPVFTKIVLPQDTEEIDAGAFAACTSLEYFSMPDSVDTIGANAFPIVFSNIRKFEITGDNSSPAYITTADGSILINDSSGTLEYVAGKAQFTSLNFSQSEFENITTIADFAFYGNQNLQSVTSFGNVKTIGSYAFAGCSSLASIDLSGVIEIDYQAFASAEALTSLGSIDALSRIHKQAFAYSGITEITIPADLEMIDDKYDPDDPDSILESQIFYRCENLKTVTIEAGISETLDLSIFEGCNALEKFVIDGSPDSTQAYKYSAVDVGSTRGVLLVREDTSTNTKSVVLMAPAADVTEIDFSSASLSDITKIETKAFRLESNDQENAKLRTITSFGNVVTIEEKAFENSSLITISDFDNVEEIGEYAFSNSSLTTISDFGNVEEIKGYAFAYSQLTTIPALTANMSIEDYAFNETNISSFQFDSYQITGTNASLSTQYSLETELIINFEIDKTTNSAAFDFLYPNGGSPILSGIYNLKSLVLNEKVILPDLTYQYYSEYPEESYVEQNRPEHDIIVFNLIGQTVESISFNGAGTVIGDYQFYCNNTYYDEYEWLFTNLRTIDLSGVTVVGEKAFGNTALSGELEIPATLIAIGAGAFANVDSSFDIVFDENDTGTWYYTEDKDTWKGWISDPTSFDASATSVTQVTGDIATVAQTLKAALTSSSVTRYFYKKTN